MQRHNLEVLKASVEAKDKQTHQKAFYDECTTDNDDMSTAYENGGGRRNSRRRKKLLSAEEEANLGMSWDIWFPLLILFFISNIRSIFYQWWIFILAAEREAQIEAFLDQIEGETLGEMMNYLSSELESTNFGHHDAAAAALQSTTSGGDENASSDIEKKSVTNGDVVIMPTKKDKNEEEKIYSEITKLTRSTVDRYDCLIFTIPVRKGVWKKFDSKQYVYGLCLYFHRYLDKIILDILYKSAAAVAEKETDQQLGNQR